ncbi:MAG: hypothetical protein CM1200mP28_03470 [Deltaproteobacteria bacterium]|nr:MAG: hypothetical protein CM1200mP28_03470 [Deltaproteobacteria bacterium]
MFYLLIDLRIGQILFSGFYTNNSWILILIQIYLFFILVTGTDLDTLLVNGIGDGLAEPVGLDLEDKI